MAKKTSRKSTTRKAARARSATTAAARATSDATAAAAAEAPCVPCAPAHADISARAHAIWIARGRPTPGTPLEDWLQAERELLAGRR